MELPQIEVRFEHLHVDAEAYVGSRALPSFLNFNVNLLEVLKNKYLQIFIHILVLYFSLWCCSQLYSHSNNS